MATLYRAPRLQRSLLGRCLATASTTPATSSRPSSFRKTLEDGPALDDFIAGDVPSRVVLGNTKGCVTYPRLPPHGAITNCCGLGQDSPHTSKLLFLLEPPLQTLRRTLEG